MLAQAQLLAAMLASVVFVSMSPVVAWPPVTQQAVIVALALLVGVLLADVAEGPLGRYTERFMNLAMGLGFQASERVDEEGIPTVAIRRLRRRYYNPTRVSETALQHLRHWEATRDDRSWNSFRRHADWLAVNLKVKMSGSTAHGVWEYSYPFSYGLRPPWRSALAQGMGVDVLGKAWKLLGEPRYHAAARLALNAFLVDVKDGGVTYRDDEDEWWFEEAVGDGARQSRVLNGMMYALVGIHNYYKSTRDPDASLLFSKGVVSLKRHLPEYDTGRWTYYDALGCIASRGYHRVHLALLRELCEISGDPSLAAVYQRWSRYRVPFVVREFVWQKPGWHDWLVLIFAVCLTLLILEIAIAARLVLRG